MTNQHAPDCRARIDALKGQGILPFLRLKVQKPRRMAAAIDIATASAVRPTNTRALSRNMAYPAPQAEVPAPRQKRTHPALRKPAPQPSGLRSQWRRTLRWWQRHRRRSGRSFFVPSKCTVRRHARPPACLPLAGHFDERNASALWSAAMGCRGRFNQTER